MGARSILLLVALTLAVAGCGEQEQSTADRGGGDQDGQYGARSAETTSPTAPANPDPVGGTLSVQECLDEASGRGKAGVEIEDPDDVPSYEVVGESGMEAGRELEVVTGATSREELRTIAEDLRYENRESEALYIDFYNESDGGDRQDAGIALVFNTREAACRAFQYPVEKQDELISSSNGITVVSVEEGV